MVYGFKIYDKILNESKFKVSVILKYFLNNKKLYKNNSCFNVYLVVYIGVVK